MAALTGPTPPPYQTGGTPEVVPYQMAASVTCYNGGLIAVNTATGYASEASDTSGYVYVGVAQIGQGTPVPQVLTNGTTAGATSVGVLVSRAHNWLLLAASGATQAWVEKLVAIADDQTVELNASSSNHVLVGRVKQYLLPSGNVMVDVSDRAPANGATAV